jgi:hypothetical protein
VRDPRSRPRKAKIGPREGMRYVQADRSHPSRNGAAIAGSVAPRYKGVKSC